MKCKFCGKEISDGSSFCGYCGKQQPQVKTCIKCGHEIRLRDKWCRYCGASQVSSEESEEPEQCEQLSSETETSVENNSPYNEESSTTEYNESESTDYTNNKKIIIALVIALIVGMGIFAFGLYRGGYIGNDESCDMCNADTVAIETEEVVQDFTTPDLKMYQLCGHVKSVEYDYGDFVELVEFITPKIVNFDREGRITNVDEFTFGYDANGHDINSFLTTGYEKHRIKVYRNSDNYLTSIKLVDAVPFWSCEYPIEFKYDNNHNLYNFYWCYLDEGNIGCKLTYSENNLVSSITQDCYGSYTLYSYKYIENDEYGNWTKREVKYIYDSPYADDAYAGDAEPHIERTYIESRKISYY